MGDDDRFSRDSILSEDKFIRVALERGLTHVAVTNHNNVEGAIAFRDRVAALGVDDRLTVILGEEVSTSDGEVVGIFLQRTIPRGLTAAQTADEIHAQGGLVSIPHPFDPFRASHIRRAPLEGLAAAGKIDMIEVFNSRGMLSRHNEEAAEFALEHGLPGVSVSDAHSIMEVGVAYTALEGDPSTPAGLLAALPSAEIVPGRASYLVRLWTPVAKGVNRVRGNGRVRVAGVGATSSREDSR